eukprot:TRINITY_DN9665_c0_g1_i2.p1 TRINITY_DN9665_c0_g1~~TRINITY_DN9665_c0_g1_i2.p1  ORF type:complete len:149 (-),score=19.40 TRINITY_DN9665_c0_g1_i2:586-1032(-)
MRALSLGPKKIDYSGLNKEGRKTHVAREPQRCVGNLGISKYTVAGVVRSALDFKRDMSEAGGTFLGAWARARARSEQRQPAKSKVRFMVEETPLADPGQVLSGGLPLPKTPKPIHRFVRERYLEQVRQQNPAERGQEKTEGAMETQAA